jgi:F-type H+-transporting ATPase subunit b
MEINFTTFILEIANFLVLVWLLQRFLYKPVLEVIARRKAGIDNALAEAARVREEAAALQEQCKERLSSWEHEKRSAQESLQRELDAQRARMLEELKMSLEDERNKFRIIEERRLAGERLKNETLALENAAVFASLLLKRAAGPELEKRLVELLLERLANLPAETVDTLRANDAENHAAISIFSAYPLADEQRAELQQGLGELLGRSLSYEYRCDPELIAGLRIAIGAWVLRLNLQDELLEFTQFAHERTET